MSSTPRTSALGKRTLRTFPRALWSHQGTHKLSGADSLRALPAHPDGGADSSFSHLRGLSGAQPAPQPCSSNHLWILHCFLKYLGRTAIGTVTLIENILIPPKIPLIPFPATGLHSLTSALEVTPAPVPLALEHPRNGNYVAIIPLVP